MKVILLQDVPKVGKKYEVKEVKNGLARNFLIPKKLVEIATAGTLKKLEIFKEKNKQEEEEKNKALRDTLSALSNKTITITVRAGDMGSLFAKITAKDIANAIKKEYNVNLPEELIILEEPIKKIGEYDIVAEVGEKKEKLKVVIKAI
ncbi:MAG: 50S ribosomal protein L9 [Parcubacteria group bacterium]|nr:50S ribosomal protein L9 [Parcubacteria group bacterium]